jgi:tetratricopeptide (TPR) repeat protein
VDPRNLDLLTDAALTYSMLRQFPAALKLYDLALDITPSDPEVIAAKAYIYQAQGKLQEAARLLSGINEQTPSDSAFLCKLDQLQLERNYGESIRLNQARLAQFHYTSDEDKAFGQMQLALVQRLAGDTGDAKVTAEQAHNIFERLSKDEPDNRVLAVFLSLTHAAMGEKDSALKEAERAIMLLPRAKDRVFGPVLEHNLAFIQTIFGENSRAISTLTELLQTPYPEPITPALLRLDPDWDPLRSDPAFQKLCEEKQK